MLTYQGSVFLGKLMTDLRKKLHISTIKMSPYHPQTDGLLERWHGTLKGILRRAGDGKVECDILLTYCLFSYRATSHVNPGLTYFELLFGRQVRGPLEVLKTGWKDGKTKEKYVVDCVSKNAEI